MKIVNILGGLGNQMFEYAMYLALRESHPEEEIVCTTHSFKGYGLHNGFELDRIFGIKIKEATYWQLAQLAYPFFNYNSWRVMRHCLPVRRRTMTRGAIDIPFDFSQVTRNDSVFYDGYWQNECNFRHIRKKVLETYVFPDFTDERNRRLVELLKTEITVSCHIRRGDYLKEPNMCVCTPSYYARSIREMNEKVKPTLYCIFSDDISWCRKNIQNLVGKDKRIVFIDWNKGQSSFRDMQLMSLCNHNIIANSSFSWWGAWLNVHEDKTVIAPKTWIKGAILNDPLCEDWIKIEG